MKKVKQILLSILSITLVAMLVVFDCTTTKVIKADNYIGALNGKNYDKN